MKHFVARSACVVLVCAGLCGPAAAQQTPPAPVPTGENGGAAHAVPVPADYVIGPEDVLSIVFWRDKELSADVVVRPDGMISLPLLNDLKASGYTPEQLSEQLVKAATKYIEEPTASVIVKAINSRKVFIVGQVSKPGAYPLPGDTTVLQLIAQAGDVLEWADKSDIVVVRSENGKEQRFKFNYKDVLKGKNVAQNIQLKPGDTVIVP